MKSRNSVAQQKIVAHIRHVTGLKNFSLDQPLKELNIDSIGALELVMDLERAFNIQVPEEKLDQLVTPRSIINMVETLLTLHVA